MSYTYESVKENLHAHDATLISTKSEFASQQLRNSRKVVTWGCSVCKNPQTTNTSARTIKVGICKSCGVKKKKGITLRAFVKLIEDEDYVMIGEQIDKKDESNYILVADLDMDKMIDTKAIYKLKCPNNHFCNTTHNRWTSAEARCKECVVVEQSHTIEDAREKFASFGLTLLEDTYVNNKTPMKYRCKCGKEKARTFGSLTETTVGCDECATDSKKWTWEEILAYCDEWNCEMISVEEDFLKTNRNRDTILDFECACGTYFEKSWRNFHLAPRCSDCSDRLRELTVAGIEPGCINVFQLSAVKEKIKNTYQERHGPDVTHNMHIPETVAKAKATNIANHNGAHNLTELVTRQKGQAVCLERHKGKCFPVTEAGRAQCMERLGVEYPLQDPDTFARRMFKHYDYTLPSGRVIKLQGYEGYALDILLEMYGEDDLLVTKEEIKNIPYVDQTGRNARYYPDFFIKSINRYIEIKSEHTYKDMREMNNLKFWWCTKSTGLPIEVWIFDRKLNLTSSLFYECTDDTTITVTKYFPTTKTT
jgi:hypothetical protein